MNITEKSVAKLQPGKKRLQKPDDQQTAFGIRVEVSGTKVFYWFQKINGTPRFRALGKYPAMSVAAARDEASKLTAKAVQWKQDGFPLPDPFAKVAKESTDVPTFRQLVAAYVERHVNSSNKKERAKNAVRATYDVNKMAETHFAAWLDRRLDELIVEDLLTVKNACGKHQVAANRCVQFIRRLFNWSAGKADGKIRFWPVANFALEIDLYEEKPRKVYLHGEDLVRFGDTLEKEGHRDLRDFLILASETGARRGDILSMKWADILWETEIWRVPNPKNDQTYDVQLLTDGMDVLKRRRAENPDAVFVFPGRGRDGHLMDIKAPWKRFKARAGLKDFHVHDIRHSVASGLADAGISLPQIGAILGHRSLQSTQRYAHLINDGLREARELGRSKMQERAMAAKKRAKLANKANMLRSA